MSFGACEPATEALHGGSGAGRVGSGEPTEEGDEYGEHAQRSEVEQLRDEVADWRQWSNEVAALLPERYDDEASQEAIILKALRDLVAVSESPESQRLREAERLAESSAMSMRGMASDLNRTQGRLVTAAAHPFKGPNDTDASMLREAALRARGGYAVGGSNTRATVDRVLRLVADLIEEADHA